MFADFDVSADGIGVEVYHVKDSELLSISNDDGIVIKYPKRSGVDTIAFLSRPLANAELKYWPTEMELTGFV